MFLCLLHNIHNKSIMFLSIYRLLLIFLMSIYLPHKKKSFYIVHTIVEKSNSNIFLLY